MTASSPAAFYLMELARVLVPVIGISFVLVAVIRSHWLGTRVARGWLIAVTSLWLFVTFANRFLLSAPMRKRFLTSAIHDYTTAHRVSLYLATTPFLWAAEELLILAFGATFFLAVRSCARRNI